MRFLILPPDASRPSLVVHTARVADAAALDELRAVLHGMGCPNGLLFDALSCSILRDTYASMDASSIVVDARVTTDDVLGPAAKAPGVPLEARVERWLLAMSANWDQALPLEPNVAAPFIADIVPAASGSLVRTVGETAA